MKCKDIINNVKCKWINVLLKDKKVKLDGKIKFIR